MFGHTLDANDIANLVAELYNWSINYVFKGMKILSLVDNGDELRNAIRIIKEHNAQKNSSELAVGMEDYFLLMKLFDAQYPQKDRVYTQAEQGLSILFLDALYNEGKLQTIFRKMGALRPFISSYYTVFTVNYDTNLDQISDKRVYHLHGSFETLHHEYDSATLKGWLMEKVKGRLLPVVKGKEYLYCNAILGYSGEDKWQKIKQYNQIYEMDVSSIPFAIPADLKQEPYPFKEFNEISGELDIIGLNPNNDGHLFKAIDSNMKLTMVTYYYHDINQGEIAKKTLSNQRVNLKDVRTIWNHIS